MLSHFRVEFYKCLYSRADALFELTDAVLCADGPVTSLGELTLTPEHRREHGAMYDAVNYGWLEPRRLRRLLAATPLPRAADGRNVIEVDVSSWLRPDAPNQPRPAVLNNEIGLPLTITMAEASTRFLVLEMGARKIGHIRNLTQIAPPRISVVTNVGTAHVGEFGGQNNIARAKARGPGRGQ